MNSLKIRFVVIVVPITAFGIWLNGCSFGNKQGVEAEKPPEPVTLYLSSQSIISDNWDELLANPLKKKYPYITVEQVKGDVNEWIAQGKSVDLFATAHVTVGRMVQMDLTEDMTPLLKKHQMAESRFQPVVLEAIRNNANGQLVGLPYYLQFFTLYYNKDIFQTLAVPFPKDGMTWDDTVELAKKVSRTYGGTSYQGFKTDQVQRLADPFGVTVVNAATNRASVINEQYKRVFELSKQFYSIPGNMPASPKDVSNKALDQFTKDKNLAMYFAVNRFSNLANSNVNWDMAQAPYYPDKPNVGGIVDSFIIGVTKTSKHQDDAFRVIETFLSDDIQLLAARKLGVVSPLANPIMQEQYAADMNSVKDKNLKAIFKNKIIASDPYSIYRSQGMDELYDVHGKYIFGEYDTNTALRVLDEQINKKIDTIKGK
ncbi:ABC transporter substrate-binding protein [Paenibacillus ginsengarvi]|uniref:ABC transporter substrate-binding protein n=1 Tax=Paenibacillus ginsengarvi TaxID=400777 RepID=UPI0013151F62|nr:extracellular solute-binding protein [Paenibacillus ginsengarvi]